MQSFHNIYILGGHKLACSYFEKIQEARKNHSVHFEKMYLITDDPNAECYKIYHDDQIIKLSNSEFLLNHIFQSKHHTLDILVPDHTAKHVMLQVFMDCVKKYSQTSQVKLAPFHSSINLPFIYKSEGDAIWALSHANWTCPAYCDEPKVCPHIKAERDWEFFEEFPKIINEDMDESTISYTYGCEAFVGEISQISMNKIINDVSGFRDKITSPNHPKAQKIIVGTHSHCHGIIGKFVIQNK